MIQRTHLPTDVVRHLDFGVFVKHFGRTRRLLANEDHKSACTNEDSLYAAIREIILDMMDQGLCRWTVHKDLGALVFNFGSHDGNVNANASMVPLLLKNEPETCSPATCKCTVCFELFVPCESHYLKSCSDPQCPTHAMCRSCVARHWEFEVERRRFFLSPINCVGCQKIVSMVEWTGLVSQNLYMAYLSNMFKLFSIRCPGCDLDASIFAELLDVSAGDEDIARATDVVHGELGNCESLVSDFTFLLERVNSYEQNSIQEYIQYLEDNVGMPRVSFLLIPKSLQSPLDCDEAGNLSGDALLIIPDIERRMNVLQHWLRGSGSRGVTPCCNAAVCFNCKYYDWHENETCEEVVRRVAQTLSPSGSEDLEITYCPACLLPFVHAGGCNSMSCLCGETFVVGSEEG